MAELCSCVLSAQGNFTAVNTFDAQFRGLPPPQWADRETGQTPRYSLNALYPVPEDILRRGHGAAGRLWCQRFWDTPDDVTAMTVKRGVGLRVYRFATPETPPVGALLYASFFAQGVTFYLTRLIETEHRGERHRMKDGWHQTCTTPRVDALEELLADWEQI